jgi:glyoxylase-like metal-dependent hydrolase (beta-lactamase superfamily II)
MIKIKSVVSGILKTNCYIIYDDITLDAVVIDPGEDGYKVINVIDKNKFYITMIINTHNHLDHSQSNDILRKYYRVPLAIHKEELDLLYSSNKPEILLYDNQIVKFVYKSFRVLHTPGHTKGSICLLFDDFLITGDTLFAGAIGRTDLPSGNYNDILSSIAKIKKLSKNLVILPGHGEKTLLQNEILYNPYLINK